MKPLAIETPHGRALAHLKPVDGAAAAVLLGHGAGGGVSAPDLVAAARAANEAGWSVALIEQPYRVAGRKSAPRAPQLDEAWLAIVDALRRGPFAGLRLVVGGRSSGARVACRTAHEADAVGVLCLAFPLEPPSRANGEHAPSRLAELQAVPVPVLVVQGTGDRFGMPPRGRRRRVVQVRGDHSLRSDAPALEAAVRRWLVDL